MQDNWQWCNKCSSLAFFGNGVLGDCAGGGQHDHTGSGNYQLAGVGDVVAGQPDWKYCGRCQSLFFSGNGSDGYCPAGGAHTDAGGNYCVSQGGTEQTGWRWCVACQNLFFAARVMNNGRPWPGKCPAPGHDGHVMNSGDPYNVQILWSPAALFPEGFQVHPAGGAGSKELSLQIPSYGNQFYATSHQPSTDVTVELFETHFAWPETSWGTWDSRGGGFVHQFWGDLWDNIGHSFHLYGHSRYGRSEPAQASANTPVAASSAPAPPTGIVSVVFSPPPTPTQAAFDSSEHVAAVFVVVNNGTVRIPPFHGSWTISDDSDAVLDEGSFVIGPLNAPGVGTRVDTTASVLLPSGDYTFTAVLNTDPADGVALASTSAGSGTGVLTVR